MPVWYPNQAFGLALIIILVLRWIGACFGYWFVLCIISLVLAWFGLIWFGLVVGFCLGKFGLGWFVFWFGLVWLGWV